VKSFAEVEWNRGAKLAGVKMEKKQERREVMNNSFARILRTTWVVCTAVLTLGTISRAQMNQSAGPNLGVAGNESQERMELSNMDALGDKDQVAAYQAFSKAQEPSQKIKLGNNFLKKYPKSPLAERVDAGLMNSYRAQQDWKNTYFFADSALALEPDDVDVLTTVAWTIPHVYSPDDTDADQKLDKAETYAKHALEVLAKIPKPADVNDSQFAAAKAKRAFQAHSALGLVYFRREDYDHSTKELELATKGNPIADQTDLFVLGADLQNLKHYSEAADAYHGCSQITGALQNQCKQNADFAKAQAEVTASK
jgi:tetratricopeptide (TPR) repeat protein